MRIGIDFDNTIICYDHVFNKVGSEKGLVPDSLPLGKGHVRDYLRQADKEDEWIWLQGYVYGSQLQDAAPYEGVNSFFKFCNDTGIDCVIVSHKTRYPYSGDTYDLHESARKWIKEQQIDLDVYFELTKQAKVERIYKLGCSFFIDDLPEFLSLEGFPKGLKKILFDPLQKQAAYKEKFIYTNTWTDILSVIKKDKVL